MPPMHTFPYTLNHLRDDLEYLTQCKYYVNRCLHLASLFCLELSGIFPKYFYWQLVEPAGAKPVDAGVG